MLVIEPDEIPSRMLTWKLVFLSHIKRRSHDDRVQLPLWETWFYSRLDVPLPAMVGTPQFCFLFSLLLVMCEESQNYPAVGNERGHIEIKDYIVFPHGEEDKNFPSRKWATDFTTITLEHKWTAYSHT